MDLHLPIFAITLILFVGVSASTVIPEIYWKNALPNTPIPGAIKRSFGNQGKISPFRVSGAVTNTINGNKNYRLAATKKEVADHISLYGQEFMEEAHMIPGRKVEMRWISISDKDDKSIFLAPNAGHSIPLSLSKLPEILSRFSVDPKSKEAAAIKNTIKDCQANPILGEKRYCATSLEGMVSFVKSILGDGLNPVSSTSETAGGSTVGKTEFGIAGRTKLWDYGSPSVVCHKETYPYAVYICHELSMTAVYRVKLVSKGMNVDAIAACHKDTSEWNPNNLYLQVLQVNPGNTTAICHFLDELTVVWTPK